MALIRCDAGQHFYDPNQHSRCPHCRLDVQVNTTKALTDDSGSFPAGSGETAPLPGGNAGFASASSSGYTRAQGGIGGVTISAPWVRNKESKESIRRPLVGWLVCIAGPNSGQDYRIFDGRNTISRSHTATICISGDNQISREETQAVIVFDRKHSMYWIEAGIGELKNLTYVNDKPLRRDADLKSHDRINMGSTTLLFIPLCDERFSWVDPEKEEAVPPAEESNT